MTLIYYYLIRQEPYPLGEAGYMDNANTIWLN